jgi:hypothetical protein
MADASLLDLEGAPFAADFDRRPFKVRHGLATHPLFSLPRLVRLAGALDTPILYFRGDHAVNQVDTASSVGAGRKRTFVNRGLARPDLSPDETIAQIEGCNAWVQLRDVARDPDYRALLGTLIEEFRVRSEPVAPGLSAPRADIFISSPGATTPFHLDEEHNFLLQIRGTKKMSIADGASPAVLDRESLRAFFLGNGELARYSEHLEQHSVHVDLAPGEGVHIPSCHPHWVQNGPAVSISFGILWFSDVTARRRSLYRVNEWLFRAGLHPRPPGERPVSDVLKTLPVTVKRRLLRTVARGPSRSTAAR